MAAFTRNKPSNMLGNSLGLDDPEEDPSLDFSPLSLTTPVNSKEKERQAKELRKKEKKQKSRLEKNRRKQEEKREKNRQAFAGQVSDQISLYNSSLGSGLNSSQNNLETASLLLEESERLMEEVRVIGDPSALEQAPKDDESFVSQMSAIKAKQEAKQAAERDAFLAAKKRKEEKKKRKKEKEKLSKEEKKKQKEEKKAKAAQEKVEREKVKVDARANFKEREKEHKAKLKQKKEQEKARKKAAKEQKELEKLQKREQKMTAESSEFLESAELSTSARGRRSSITRRLSNGLGLLAMVGSKKKRESIRTRNGIQPRTDILNLWGVDASSKAP